jgi:hypothetical protein
MFTCFIKNFEIFTECSTYSNRQSFLNFLRILNRLEVSVYDRAVKLESPCTMEQDSSRMRTRKENSNALVLVTGGLYLFHGLRT